MKYFLAAVMCVRGLIEINSVRWLIPLCDENEA